MGEAQGGFEVGDAAAVGDKYQVASGLFIAEQFLTQGMRRKSWTTWR